MPLRRQRYDPNTKHSRSLIREHDFGYRGAGPKGFRGIDPYGNSPSSEALRQRALRDPATQAMRGEIGKTSGLSSQRGMIGLPSPTGGVMAERIRTPRARNTRDEYRIQQQVAALSREAFDKQRLDSARTHELALGKQRFVTPEAMRQVGESERTVIGEEGATSRTAMTTESQEFIAQQKLDAAREQKQIDNQLNQANLELETLRAKAIAGGQTTPEERARESQLERQSEITKAFGKIAANINTPADVAAEIMGLARQSFTTSTGIEAQEPDAAATNAQPTAGEDTRGIAGRLMGAVVGALPGAGLVKGVEGVVNAIRDTEKATGVDISPQDEAAMVWLDSDEAKKVPLKARQIKASIESKYPTLFQGKR